MPNFLALTLIIAEILTFEQTEKPIETTGCLCVDLNLYVVCKIFYNSAVTGTHTLTHTHTQGLEELAGIYVN